MITLQSMTLSRQDSQIVLIPLGAEILSVTGMEGEYELWYMGEEKEQREALEIQCYGLGMLKMSVNVEERAAPVYISTTTGKKLAFHWFYQPLRNRCC